ncbi:MAG: inosine/xanthosine triphosphatase [Candidatus Methanofastidiosa archaeon]|nr:inosine/xanthosine triphosphatase [Candidatus Methanofastidiosa archaeon]
MVDEHVKIGVGSLNPVKVNAVRTTFEEVFEHLGMASDIDVVGFSVESGVPDQPIGLEAIYKGAQNRAMAVYNKHPCDYNIGLEAGIYRIGDTFLDLQFCVIMDMWGWTTVGHGGGFSYPMEVIEGVRGGDEVGKIFAKISGNQNIKNQEGAIGLLSKGFIDRTAFSKQSVLMALIPRMSPKLYVKR